MTYLLYAATVLIWGSTWIGVKFQLNGTPEDVSVGARFIFAACVLFTIAALSRRRIRLPRACWPMVATQGALMFCLNYLLVYRGTNYISSGLMAVIFTLLIPANQLNEYLFFRRPVSRRVAFAGLLGALGVTLMFWPQLRTSDWSGGALAGIGLGIASVYLASLGNMAATVNTGRRLPVMAVNAWGMLLGGSMSLGLAVALGEPLRINWDPRYTWSFLYLAVFGSAVAFTCYLMLIERIGSARAAYSSVLLPIVAMLISTVVEDFRWSAMALAGVVIALAGNAIALTGKRQRPAANA